MFKYVVAPFKLKRTRSCPYPWLNDDTRDIRQKWRKAERNRIEGQITNIL